MTNIYELFLTANDGRERKTLVWLPTEAIKQELLSKAKRNGLKVQIFNL